MVQFLETIQTKDFQNHSLIIAGCDLRTDYRMDRTLRRYIEATKLHMAGRPFLSVRCDKSRVGNNAISNGIIVASDNKAAWMVPQVFLRANRCHRDCPPIPAKSAVYR